MHPEFMPAAVAARVQDLMGSSTPSLLGRRRKYRDQSWAAGVLRRGVGIRWLGRGRRTPPTPHSPLNVIDTRC